MKNEEYKKMRFSLNDSFGRITDFVMYSIKRDTYIFLYSGNITRNS